MHHDDHDDDPNGGLTVDLPGLLGRRRLLTLLGVGGAALLVGCGSEDEASSTISGSTASTSPGSTAATTASTTGSTSVTTGSAATETTVAGTVADIECGTIPQETAGPFPGDGSNGPNVLADSAAVRQDITASFGSSTTVAEGVPLTVDLVVVDTANGCTPMPGAAVYVWHCDREGRYSLYSDGVTEENYLRGVQETDADGRATFQSIFPGAYPGRWPHIHFEVYRSLAEAASSNAAITTSQIAMPTEACEAAYTAAGYEASVRNFASTPLSRDNVFGDDGGVSQLPTWSGDATSGFSVELVAPV